MNSKDLDRLIRQDGWFLARQKGGHRQYKHPTKHGVVTIPLRNVNKNIELSVMRQAGLR